MPLSFVKEGIPFLITVNVEVSIPVIPVTFLYNWKISRDQVVLYTDQYPVPEKESSFVTGDYEQYNSICFYFLFSGQLSNLFVWLL